MIELIPAIDIIDGKCVRLSQGDYNTQKVIYFLCVIISLRKTDAFAINNVDGRN